MYNEKIRLYFKKIGVSQIEVGKRLGHSPAMISRFWSGTSVFDANFIIALVKEFPEIDLKYIFSSEAADTSVAPELEEDNSIKEEDVIRELELIEKKISNIKKVLAQSCHKK
jgi:transcriptional regulator with XRE-family HTH domain